MQNYAAGWNMGGYGAEPDNIWVTDDWQSAVTYLADTIDTWWNQDYWSLEPDAPAETVDARYLDIHTELHNMPTGPEYHGIVADQGGYAYHFWIVPTDEPMQDE